MVVEMNSEILKFHIILCLVFWNHIFQNWLLKKYYSKFWSFINLLLFWEKLFNNMEPYIYKSVLSIKFTVLLIIYVYFDKMEWKSSPSKGKNFLNLLLTIKITLRNISWKDCSNIEHNCHENVNNVIWVNTTENTFPTNNFSMVHFKANYKNFILFS